MLRIKLHIAGNEQVEKTVMIVVSPGGTGRPAADGNSGFFSYVRESSIVVVVVEPVLAVIRDVKVRPPIVVVVAHCHAETPPFIPNPRFFRGIGEGSVVVVVKEHGLWGCGAAFQSIEG